MKSIITIILLVLSITCFSQNTCKCFQNLDYKIDIEDNQAKVKKCLKKEMRKNKSFYEKEFSETESAIEFIKKMVNSCEAFLDFVIAHSVNNENLSESERLEIIEQIVNLFSYQTQKGTLSKIVHVNINEIGVLYNKPFHILYKDSLFVTGTHYIGANDSLIIFDVSEKSVSTELDVLTKEGISSNIECVIRYSVKKEKCGHLYAAYRTHYETLMIVPTLRFEIRNLIGQYTAAEIEVLRQTELERLILEKLEENSIQEYINIKALFIKRIDYPLIVQKINKNNLLQEYNDLKNTDTEIRKEVIIKLLSLNTEISYLILLEHWYHEKDEELKSIIIRGLIKE